jgi:hypothetical protein
LTTKTAIKLLPGVGFIAGLGVDYLERQSQKLVNGDQLKQQIIAKIILDRDELINIINDPFGYSNSYLFQGDILFVDRGLYQHYGIYIGDNKVIHFSPKKEFELNPEHALIHEASLEDFLRGGVLQIDRDTEANFDKNEIVNRAKSQIGVKGYDLFSNNCEHFARWCVTGEYESTQVTNLANTAGKLLSTAGETLDSGSKLLELLGSLF